jgi:tetratricopeptide (TPR) repeat protein
MHCEVAFAFEDLGRICIEQGNLRDATINYGEALRIERKLFGDASQHVVRCLTALGRIHYLESRFTEALDTLSLAIEFAVRLPDTEHHFSIPAQINLGLVRLEQGDGLESERLLLTAMRRATGYFGPNHTLCGNVFFHLSEVYKRRGWWVAAERAIRKALRIYGSANHQANSEEAAALTRQGEILEALGRMSEAMTSFQAAFKTLQVVRPPGHLQTVAVEQQISRLYRKGVGRVN